MGGEGAVTMAAEAVGGGKGGTRTGSGPPATARLPPAAGRTRGRGDAPLVRPEKVPVVLILSLRPVLARLQHVVNRVLQRGAELDGPPAAAAGAVASRERGSGAQRSEAYPAAAIALSTAPPCPKTARARPPAARDEAEQRHARDGRPAAAAGRRRRRRRSLRRSAADEAPRRRSVWGGGMHARAHGGRLEGRADAMAAASQRPAAALPGARRDRRRPARALLSTAPGEEGKQGTTAPRLLSDDEQRAA